MGMMHQREAKALFLAGYGLLALLVAGLFWLAPTSYAFYYSDAPRHALNGAFILDLARDLPISDPVQWAYNYYAQYPALTILFYPPLYPVFLAVAYAVFGISQATAIFVNALFYMALVTGSYRLARRYVSDGSALAAALMVGAAPEIAFWGRQIMTDVPATAALVWATELFLAYGSDLRARHLYVSAAMAAMAVWLKITVCFLLPVLAFGLVLVDGRTVLRRSRNWCLVIGMVVAMLPLLWLTVHFGQTNVQSVAGVADGAAPRLSLANWLWYAERLPAQIGWPAVAAVIVGVYVGIVRFVRCRRIALRWALLAGWVVVGYLFFSTIDLKHARFTIPLLPPLIVLGVWGVERLFAGMAHQAHIVLAGLGAATLAITLIYRPPLYVSGYAKIVKSLTRRAPEHSNIIFSGYRDGAFIFAMRAIGNRPDVGVIRADKLLLSVAIRRSTGVKEKNLTAAQIADQITRFRGAYVVAQDGFWTDLTEMKRLQEVLHSSQFKAVAHYRLDENFNAPDKTITVYRNEAKLPVYAAPLSISLPAVNRTVTQKSN
ncbi:ArnT family glycosyltransferase [Salinisphaera hydrothermalis]|uniref:ArnT family glycosyltransferase n=1 Tax=Salinisphaera hydrothermalis TaxID=563188 RepID=UPI00334248AC